MHRVASGSRARPGLARIVLLAFALATSSGCAGTAPGPRAGAGPSTGPTAASAAARDRGAVASAEPEATRAGLAVLGRGGNAVDAAVATALALAVVQPWAGNLGGGGFAVVRQGERVETLDFRETAPAAAHPKLFVGPDGAPLAPDGSLVGPLAAATPGSPAGLHALQRRRGRLPWPDVVAPAITLARDGFVLSARGEAVLREERALLARFPSTAAVWLPGGEPLRAGTRLRLPALAATLSAYAERGPEAITRGPVAAALEAAARDGGGTLTAADLAAYAPAWRDPLRFEAFGWQIATMPLPSSGGIILAETLGMIERRAGGEPPRDAPGRAHLLVEAWRRAFADRFSLGDPAWTVATAEDLLDPAWLDRRAAGIDPARATPSAALLPWSPSAATGRARFAGDGGRPDRGGQTTHLSVADGEGGFVALTTTLNGWFGCGLWVAGAGFFLNNEMDDFTTVPDRPNLFGLIQGEANLVRAGARPLSSMTPTIAWRGAETIVLGSPNGSRIPTAITQVWLAIAIDGLPLAAALDRPRLHHQWQPDRVRHDAGLDEALLRGLEAAGHVLEPAPWTIGEVNVVRSRDGRLEAAADRRGQGFAGVLGPREGAGDAD